jgi:hypothetical protein
MTRTLLLAALALATAAPRAQSGDPALAPTADRFADDLSGIAHLAATAALFHGQYARFPATPFELLGSREATATGLRAFQLSELVVELDGDTLRLRVVPLPAPYVRDDRVVAMTVAPLGDGQYRVTHEIRRRADADDGGRAMPYDRAPGYEVGRAFGTLCVDLARVRALLDAGTFAPDPARLSAEPLTLRVAPPGRSAPAYYQTTEPARRP